MTEAPRLAPSEALAEHASGATQFLDVRDAHELAATGMVPGALHVPLLEMPTAPAIAALDPMRPVIVYCAAGVRAGKAGEALLARGFTSVRNMGGFKDWVAAGGAIAPYTGR